MKEQIDRIHYRVVFYTQSGRDIGEYAGYGLPLRVSELSRTLSELVRRTQTTEELGAIATLTFPERVVPYRVNVGRNALRYLLRQSASVRQLLHHLNRGSHGLVDVLWWQHDGVLSAAEEVLSDLLDVVLRRCYHLYYRGRSKRERERQLQHLLETEHYPGRNVMRRLRSEEIEHTLLPLLQYLQESRWQAALRPLPLRCVPNLPEPPDRLLEYRYLVSHRLMRELTSGRLTLGLLGPEIGVVLGVLGDRTAIVYPAPPTAIEQRLPPPGMELLQVVLDVPDLHQRARVLQPFPGLTTSGRLPLLHHQPAPLLRLPSHGEVVVPVELDRLDFVPVRIRWQSPEQLMAVVGSLCSVKSAKSKPIPLLLGVFAQCHRLIDLSTLMTLLYANNQKSERRSPTEFSMFLQFDPDPAHNMQLLECLDPIELGMSVEDFLLRYHGLRSLQRLAPP